MWVDDVEYQRGQTAFKDGTVTLRQIVERFASDETCDEETDKERPEPRAWLRGRRLGSHSELNAAVTPFAIIADIAARYPRELLTLAADESTGVRDDARVRGGPGRRLGRNPRGADVALQRG